MTKSTGMKPAPEMKRMAREITDVPISAGASIAVGMEEEFARYLVEILNSDYRDKRARLS